MPVETTISFEPASEYHNWPEVSASQLKEFAASPWGFYRRFIAKDAPPKTSAVLSYGTLLHSWHELLDGLDQSRFWDRVRIAPANVVTATGQLGKAAEPWLADQPPDCIPVSPADAETLRLQTEQLLLNPAVTDLLEAATWKEGNIRFAWGDRGHLCRSRIDGATPEVFYDLKSTREVDPVSRFDFACANFRYDIQAAFYGRAALQAGWPRHRMAFIATSTVYPYDCAVMVLPPDVIQQAERDIDRMLNELEHRRNLDWWTPAHYGQVIEMPNRAFIKKGRGW